jgi:hypothetical protein
MAVDVPLLTFLLKGERGMAECQDCQSVECKVIESHGGEVFPIMIKVIESPIDADTFIMRKIVSTATNDHGTRHTTATTDAAVREPRKISPMLSHRPLRRYCTKLFWQTAQPIKKIVRLFDRFLLWWSETGPRRTVFFSTWRKVIRKDGTSARRIRIFSLSTR